MGAIKERYDAGAVIAGSSAGTACQTSAVMIRGNRAYMLRLSPSRCHVYFIWSVSRCFNKK